MKLSFTTAFADAVRFWQRDSAVLLPLAGATMFLPQYAVLLLVPSPSLALKADGAELTTTDPATRQAMADAMSAWLSHYGGWYALAPLIGLFGALSIMAFYLAPGRPTLGRAMGRGAMLLLRYLLASILTLLAALSILLPGALSGVLLAALMPLGFYVLGRTMLAGPVIVAQAPVGALAAIQRSWAATRGHGWMLAASYAAPLFAAQLIGSVLLSLGQVGGGNPVVVAITDGLAAMMLAGAGLTLALFETALYRRLARSGT